MKIVDGLSVKEIWHNITTEFGVLSNGLDWNDPINWVVAIAIVTWTAGVIAVLGNWLIDVFSVMVCTDDDSDVKGHRLQHIDIVVWAIIAEAVVGMWMLTHHEASGAGWLHTWNVHLVNEYLALAILVRGIHNLKVARHLHKELGGSGW